MQDVYKLTLSVFDLIVKVSIITEYVHICRWDLLYSINDKFFRALNTVWIGLSKYAGSLVLSRSFIVKFSSSDRDKES